MLLEMFALVFLHLNVPEDVEREPGLFAAAAWRITLGQQEEEEEGQHQGHVEEGEHAKKTNSPKIVNEQLLRCHAG